MESHSLLENLRRMLLAKKGADVLPPGHSRHQIVREPIKRALIHNAPFLFTAGADEHMQILRGHSIIIENDAIREVRPAKEVKIEGFDLIYDAGKRGGVIVTPGLVNTHTHPPMYLLRGVMGLEEGEAIDDTIAAMPAWERAMTDEDYTVATVGDLTEQQKHGITATLSHYGVFYPIEYAARLTGQFVINALSVASNTHPENTPALITQLLAQKDSFCSRPAVALHYLYKASGEILAQIKKLAQEHGLFFTCHLAESQGVADKCRKAHGAREAAVLEKYGLLNQRTVVSHALYLNDDEIEKLADGQVGIAHLPTSNVIHKSGTFPFWKFDAAGAFARIALGTDSVVSKSRLDILSEAYQTRLTHLYERTVKFSSLFKMMTANGGRILGEMRGKILPVYKADLAFWKLKDRGAVPYDEANPITLIGNLITHGGRFVRDLTVNGRFVIKDRRHQLVDESKLLSELQKAHMAMRERVNSHSGAQR